MSEQLETDYLIVGAGAMGMAFADTLLSETDADMIIIDRHGKPGGHWNLAYPFVRLHQPAAYYGVSSRQLGSGEIDQYGSNKGMYDLASGAEVSAYFDDVMRQRFLPSGRVRFFSMSDYRGDGQFVSRTSGKTTTVRYKKLVDATRLTVDVPAAHTPAFSIADGVRFMPLNDLPRLTDTPEGYVVIGSGKTGIDACLWLLDSGVPADAIQWIIPRDAWWLMRENAQPDEQFFEDVFGTQAAHYEAIAAAENVSDMFDRLEACGYFTRLDPNVRPTMFHAATISRPELAAIRQIKNIVRMGRVTALETDRIVLDEGEIATTPNHVHVDCSASLSRTMVRMSPTPIFDGNVITPQTVRSYMPVFSGSVIAYIEAHYDDIEQKNQLCQVVPLPNTAEDFIPMTLMSMANQRSWAGDKELRRWVRNNRLDGFGKVVESFDTSDQQKVDIMMRIRDNAPKAAENLFRLWGEISA